MKSGNKFIYIYLSKREVEIYFRLLTFPDEFGGISHGKCSFSNGKNEFPREFLHFPTD